MRVAIYSRVSTAQQNTQNQILDLKKYAESRGWEIVREFEDKGVSGTKESRPGLNALLDEAYKRKFELILIWRLDRFFRGALHMLKIVEELNNAGVKLCSYSENLDFTSPIGKAMLTVLSALAEMERTCIVERVHAGLRRARANGKTLGRPKKTVSVEKIKQLRRENKTLSEIGQVIGASKSYVSQLLIQEQQKAIKK